MKDKIISKIANEIVNNIGSILDFDEYFNEFNNENDEKISFKDFLYLIKKEIENMLFIDEETKNFIINYILKLENKLNKEDDYEM